MVGAVGVHRILYEEVGVSWWLCGCAGQAFLPMQVCESGVEVMFTFNPSTQSVEDYRYPRPGQV